MNAHKSFKLISILFVATFLVACTRPQLWKMPWDSEITRANKEATQIVERLTATAIVEAARGTPGAQPYATAEGTPAPQPIDAGACRLDKVATYSEVNSAGPQRIEVGGHGVQHHDFYPNRGVESVSYIIPAITPPQTPAVWNGFGSEWEGNGPVCANYDYVADATAYASARLDSGHSGLVVDMRSGSPVVVANVANLSQTDIDSLLAVHRQGQPSAVTVGMVPTTTPRISGIGGGQTTSGSCGEPVLTRYPDVSSFSVSGPAIVQPYRDGSAQYGLLMKFGETAEFVAVKGDVWQFASSASCDNVATRHFSDDAYAVTNLAELQSWGWVK